jgi:hypothetical protein
MKYLLVSLALIAVSSPAFAHVQAVSHVHGNDYGLRTGAFIICAALIIGFLRRNKVSISFPTRHEQWMP